MSCVMPRKGAGIALMSVLWVLVLLTVVAAAAAAGLRNEARLATNLVAAAQARAAAEAGVQLALFHLALGGEGRWQAGGSVQLRFGEASVRVALANEAGKVDLNFAPQAVLENLLTPALAERIVEKRKHAPFETVEELQRIPGMPPDLFRKVRWALTVHSQPGVGSATIGIHAQASLPSGARAQIVSTVDLRRPGQEGPFRVLDWREEAEQPF
jgi:general secretion pathway protein K